MIQADDWRRLHCVLLSNITPSRSNHRVHPRHVQVQPHFRRRRRCENLHTRLLRVVASVLSRAPRQFTHSASGQQYTTCQRHFSTTQPASESRKEQEEDEPESAVHQPSADQTLYTGQFLEIKQKQYTNIDGVLTSWEYVSRPNATVHVLASACSCGVE